MEWFERHKNLLVWLVVGGLVWVYWPWRLHTKINQARVVRVEVHPKGGKSVHVLPDPEARQVITWFNAATSVVNNSHHGAPGCGSYSTVQFHFTSGKVIEVFSYMRVTRGDNDPRDSLDDLDADYYFKQPELEAYLREWNRKADAGGC